MEIDKLKTEIGGALPKHVGIIMDGNGRWAKRRGFPRAAGHRVGTERLRGIITLSSDVGIEALSLYAFSTENWKRPQSEVGALFAIFMEYFARELEALHQNNVCIRALGDLNKLPQNVNESLENARALTENNTGLKLNIALNYGSRAEAAYAARELAREVRSGIITLDAIDENALMDRLYTHGLPDIDLIIRTGGDMRLSNFLLLQAAYAELKFVDTFWPDFSDELYAEVLREFSSRKRRFGGLGETK